MEYQRKIYEKLAFVEGVLLGHEDGRKQAVIFDKKMGFRERARSLFAIIARYVVMEDMVQAIWGEGDQITIADMRGRPRAIIKPQDGQYPLDYETWEKEGWRFINYIGE